MTSINYMTSERNTPKYLVIAAQDLTKQELDFAHAFLVCGDRVEAIKRSGIETPHPARMAYQMLQRPHVKNYIDLEMKIYIDEMKERGAISKYKKMGVIWKMINNLLQIAEESDNSNIYDVAKKIKAYAAVKDFMDMLNKMEGHYINNDSEKEFNTAEELKLAKERMPDFFKDH